MYYTMFLFHILLYNIKFCLSCLQRNGSFILKLNFLNILDSQIIWKNSAIFINVSTTLYIHSLVKCLEPFSQEYKFFGRYLRVKFCLDQRYSVYFWTINIGNLCITNEYMYTVFKPICQTYVFTTSIDIYYKYFHEFSLFHKRKKIIVTDEATIIKSHQCYMESMNW